ncbi:MAG TPA: hypothetical protein VHE55_18705 [Fimbriimonadaceae bacterium]|nr:hypothetical protein [Fimbriimonadaceae bacterium]
MLTRVRLVAVWILCLPYVMAGAQGISGLIKSPPVPETMAIKDMPADFKAVDIQTTASDFAGAMQMSMFSMAGSGAGNSFEMYQLFQTSWTNGQTINSDAGEFLVTYKLGFTPPSEGSYAPKMASELRLSLIRKDSIIGISPRNDLKRERLLEMMSPEAQTARQTENSRTAALSNMKQLALGMIMYSSDYDDVVPYVQDSKSALAVTMPYLKNGQLTKSLNPGSRILMNMAIAGVEMTAIEAPAETVLYYDEKPWPDGSRLVAFMDGHVKFVEPEAWAKAEATLHLKIKRKTKPLPPDYWKKLHSIDDIGS